MYSYYVHNVYYLFLEVALWCLVIKCSCGVYCLLESYIMLFSYYVHGAYYPFMEATLSCSIMPMVCFKPNVCGVNYILSFFVCS
jgi:hypothetical protein